MLKFVNRQKQVRESFCKSFTNVKFIEFVFGRKKTVMVNYTFHLSMKI